MNKLLPDNSLGFRKGIRTEDAMFVLKKVSEKYQNLGKKIYTVFVDFAKFYDTIDHGLLLDKIYNLGISGNVFNVIRNMYKNVQYSVKISEENGTRLTAPFKSNIGLKQGCPLSPTLANLFLHDIHKNFDTGDIELEGKHLNSITWADDLVFFTLSQQNAQNSLNSLSDYCKKMKLKVNLDKTQAMIISKGCVKYNNHQILQLNNDQLKYVSSYKYLGVEFQQNGKFKEIIKTRILKAQNAIYMIKRACASAETTSIEMYKKLFESKIFPILMYGSAIWGSPADNRLHVTSETEIDKIMLSKISKTEIKDIKIHKNKLGASLNCYTFEGKLKLIHNKELREKFKLQSLMPDITKSKIETFVNKCCKQILGVKKCCNSALARIHLGWTPISLKIWASVIKYWLRSYEVIENEILKSAFLHSENNYSIWKDGIQNILTVTGAADTWNDPKQKLKYGSASQTRVIQNRLIDINYQNCQSELENSKKHAQYSQFHSIDRTKPQYLDKIKDPRHRTTITKLRTHSHCLQTETGNYTKTTEGERNYKCPNCDSDKNETVTHFLWECSWGKNKATRSALLQSLPIDTKDHLKLTKSILNLDFKSPDTTTQKIYSLVHKMYKIREKAFRKPTVKINPPIFSMYHLTFLLAFLPNLYKLKE
jgi:ribosomal protein L37AE/L43A